MVASLAEFLLLVQEAGHRADRAEVLALIQQGRVNLDRGLVGQRLAVEHVEDPLPLLVVQGPRRLRPATPIERGPRHAQAAAGP